ncbi:DNA-deoxyinosine glycosylase [Alkalimonas amylolytica]|uniref:G/U mismatch-specific uracil-DNA glycosylase n=1 Tax=Alkalimonas amylolytica TaxID=152573 RepID=A0A1H4EGL7_ALKAM|nr:DNA-deoxyinosine glycosylase [Alkalimonas amylolytica]SEA84153.1 G/U mismatch-specific uracil-DNA glycosylase [Alkalimonas amylolytica]
MNQLTGLAPVSHPDARALLLGSMPGAASLAQQQYYGHPRNHFWPMMAELFGFDAALAYPERLQALQRNRVALWDVLQHCERQGSLDSAIRNETPNDFAGFFQRHRQLQLIAFNGKKAEDSFRKLVLPKVMLPKTCSLLVLPSSSPANAGISRPARLQAWSQLVEQLQ